ncbi:hypothetical protein [Actinomadura sp. 7K507]|uniref:hypothetical protein n=1 Tax=Actinomadura sp. 7K507 TaxID=2530365 RepID=UPI0032613A75
MTTRPSRRPARASSRDTCRPVPASPRPTLWDASTASTTRRCPAGGPGSNGAATNSHTIAPAPLDLPGRTWCDRPAIDQGDGRFLAGDMVAAPGILAEVSINSALTAASKAIAQTR